MTKPPGFTLTLFFVFYLTLTIEEKNCINREVILEIVESLHRFSISEYLSYWKDDIITGKTPLAMQKLSEPYNKKINLGNFENFLNRNSQCYKCSFIHYNIHLTEYSDRFYEKNNSNNNNKGILGCTNFMKHITFLYQAIMLKEYEKNVFLHKLKLEIEHIFPSSDIIEKGKTSGAELAETHLHFGNMIFLESEINKRCADNELTNKIKKYNESLVFRELVCATITCNMDEVMLRNKSEFVSLRDNQIIEKIVYWYTKSGQFS